MIVYLAWSRTWYRVRGSSLSSVKEKGNWKGLVRLAIVLLWLVAIVSSFIVCSSMQYIRLTTDTVLHTTVRLVST